MKCSSCHLNRWLKQEGNNRLLLGRCLVLTLDLSPQTWQANVRAVSTITVEMGIKQASSPRCYTTTILSASTSIKLSSNTYNLKEKWYIMYWMYKLKIFLGDVPVRWLGCHLALHRSILKRLSLFPDWVQLRTLAAQTIYDSYDILDVESSICIKCSFNIII